MVCEQEKDGSARCDNYAIQAQSGNPGKTQYLSQPPANDCAQDSKKNIEHHPFTTTVYEMTRNKSGQQP
jgi:hypothetical protein